MIPIRIEFLSLHTPSPERDSAGLPPEVNCACIAIYKRDITELLPPHHFLDTYGGKYTPAGALPKAIAA
jgi:hypothetical protein